MRIPKLLLLAVVPLVLARGPGMDGGDDSGDDDGDDGGDASPTASAVGATPSSTAPAGLGDGMTGDSQCTALMCITAMVNGSSVEYVLQSTGAHPVGWMAMGFGEQMANSPMVIMWSNSDGGITLSQRQAPAEVMPTVVASPPRVATMSPSLSSTSGNQPKYAYSIAANSDTTQNIIWAFGSSNPESSAVNAPLVQHLQSGTLSLDLTKSLSNMTMAPGSSLLPAGTSVSIPLLPYQKLIIAHAIVMATVFLLLLPAGALLARWFRTFTPRWFKGHWIVQFAITGPTILIGVILGVASVISAGAPHFNDNHKKLGMAIFALYLLQCALGAFIHFVKPKLPPGVPRKRPPQNYGHAILGLTIIFLAFYQIRQGYKIEWPSTTGRGPAPGFVNIIWIIAVVLIPLLYTLGLFLLRRQYTQEGKLNRGTLLADNSITDEEFAEQLSLTHEMRERTSHTTGSVR